MEQSDAVLVRRPQRWDQPLDPTMTDADVVWLRTRSPFATMRDDAFPSATPLTAILRNDCRIRRCQPGEIIVREGDYGNSAFLVVAGSVRVSLERLPECLLGRDEPKMQSWWQAIRQLWRRPMIAEVRDEQTMAGQGDALHDSSRSMQARLEQCEDRPAIFLQDFSGVFADRKSLCLGPGELFGEMAAMYRSPQTATVVAEGETTLVEVRWQGLRLLRRDRAFSEQLEKVYREHWLTQHLRETPLFRFLPENVLQHVARATTLRSFGRMEWHTDFQKLRKLPVEQQIEQEPLIAIEGQLPTDLILIRAGFARVSQAHGAGHQTTAYLGKGHMAGFAEVAFNATRPFSQPPVALQQSLRAVGFVDTLHIPIEIFSEHVLPYIRREELPLPESFHLEQKLEPAQLQLRDGEERRVQPREKPGEGQAAVVAAAPSVLSTGLVEFLVQERLTNGRQAMVIDLDRCTRCDDCVKACATTHGGNPRMTRSGPINDRLQFAQACMHCTDPVCMIGCPTGAIARDQATGTIRINEPICVGCGTCASSCPYGNIQMVEVHTKAGRVYRDETTGLPILKATKCDLCHSQPSGPACVNACPHDAMARIDLSLTGPLDAWLGRRRP